ncbi:MAG: hypothetical protein KJO00_01970 [Bacteroidia bacterium]|nr:hypothetical protein [Bacteroidia bacterium]NNK74198.1 hypothetical protein [Flavobacteriaceae bacterium]
MPVKLEYSIKDIKRETNDSTYIESVLKYQVADGSWKDINVQLRARGNYRLKNCYFPPIKFKITKANYKGTLFDGQRRLKMVTPCLTERDRNDNVIKEYMAYKIYELVSPQYFKTRLVDIEFNELRGSRSKAHIMKGFLIEDDKHIAKRLDGKMYSRNVHPRQQEDTASVRHALFQYLIGNTDYSQAYQHNVKIMFSNKKFIPLPYDFDMAGLVNCSYAVVSQIQNQQLPLTSVRQRLYRGFKRNPGIYSVVRKEFLRLQPAIMAEVEACRSEFEYEREYEVARDYVVDFFKVISDNDKFRSEILDKARTE